MFSSSIPVTHCLPKRSRIITRGRTFFQALESRCLLSGDPGSSIFMHWSDVACVAARNAPADHRGPTWISRTFAMVQGAVFDAVNSIDGSYEGYLVHEQFPRWASMDAAAAQAAHDVLAGLYPTMQPMLDAELTASLATIRDGKSEDAGVAAGHFAATKMLLDRAIDGAQIDQPYTANTNPGHWQPDPLHPTQAALGVFWGNVKPFVLPDVNQIHVAAIPDMNSQAYTDAYNQVKALGADGITTPTTRTAEQTQIGLFWAYDVAPMGTPCVLYNQVIKNLGLQMKNSLVENARLFALANFAMADTGIVTWKVKYADDFWRPVTAIRAGDTDGNPNTTADPTWTPLGAPGDSYATDFTPPFPAYTSGHAGFGEATFAILRQFFGTDKMKFTLTSDEYDPSLGGRNPVTRSYDTFSQASFENAISRIYLGVHWIFDATEGISLGHQVAAEVFASALRKSHDHGRGQENNNSPTVPLDELNEHQPGTSHITVALTTVATSNGSVPLGHEISPVSTPASIRAAASASPGRSPGTRFSVLDDANDVQTLKMH